MVDATNATGTRAPLEGTLTVVDLTVGISGGYASKLLADGGADVIKVETPSGDPLRSRALLGGDGVPNSRLFQFLHGSQRSVVIDPAAPADVDLLTTLLRGAHAVLWANTSPFAAHFSPAALHELTPHAAIVAMTPFGLVGEPSRPANEFILQALASGPNCRGEADREPTVVGGDFGDYILGTFAAVGLLTAHQRIHHTGIGEIVDVAGLDAMHLTQTMFAGTFFAASGRPYRPRRIRTIPLIHPTSDGYVGFQITTGQQWQDFSALVERPDWAEDPTLTRFDVRMARFEEVNTYVDGWTSQRTTDEIVETAALMRIPVAPVADGATVSQFAQCLDRGWFVQNPSGGFIQPVPHYTMHGGGQPHPFGPAPSLGEHTQQVRNAPPAPLAIAPTGVRKPLPFEGLRVADLTAFWAGPIIGHFFAMFGADVIHIESTKRPDGIRAATLKSDMGAGWWEASPTFAATNTNKRGLTLDLGSEDGRRLAKDLIAQCDIVIENYSARVMEHWGFDYDSLKAVRPDLIMLRAPGFGLSGPWRERVAYATTIEQACGAAWMTGFEGERPDVAGGALDPIAGTHAAFAALLALEHRRVTGEGALVEVPQFCTGINVFAELAIEHSATGRVLERNGNRSSTVAPQGAYRVLDQERAVAGVPTDEWVAISVENDDQWHALCSVIGAPDLAADPALATAAGRFAAHDTIDAAITSWTRDLAAADVIEAVCAAGVPAAVFVQNFDLVNDPDATRRGLYEMVDNPVLGTVPIVGHPVRLSEGPAAMHRRRAPLLGEHNREILEGLLGLAPAEVDQLEADGVIGQTPFGMTAW